MDPLVYNNHKVKNPSPQPIEVKENQPQFTPLDTSVKPAKPGSPKAAIEKRLIGQRSLDTYDEITELDKEWARHAFLISDEDFDPATVKIDLINRYWTTASNKFTDTRLGGNIGINPRPQFTRYSDIRAKGRIAGRSPNVTLNNVKGNYGMGRYYSEAIDDNAQTIYLRFGVPQFSSLFSFFSKAFDPHMSTLARTGRSLSTWYQIGNIAGTILTVTAFPAISSTILAGRVLSLFFSRPTSKFYTLKPTMFNYWTAVQTLVNSIAINKGILPRFMEDAGLSETSKGQQIGSPYKIDNTLFSLLNKAQPDVYTDSNGFDIFAMATRAQRVANQQFKQDYEKLNRASASDFTGFIKKSYQDKITTPPGSGLGAFLNNLSKLGSYYTSDDKDSRLEMNPKTDPATGAEVNDVAKDAFFNYFDAEFNMGAQFAIFKVDHTGSVSEAVSNTAVESDISQKFNSISSTARSARFTFADGNTGSDLVDQVLGAAADVVKGAANGLTLNIFEGLSGLAGSGFIDIPKHWQSSNVQLPQSNYTMQLISPYGNAVSQMQNIFIPLAMILAGALPLSTGSQSYTSPFICQLYDRGRAQIQLGMIQSLSITRGTCNLPFNNRGSVNAIDVSFTVADLSSIMHMPISTGSMFGSLKTIDEDNILMDYLAVLAGQDIYSQMFALPKAKLNFAKTLRGFQNFTSPAYWAAGIHDMTTTGMLSYLFPVGPILEGIADAPATITR